MGGSGWAGGRPTPTCLALPSNLGILEMIALKLQRYDVPKVSLHLMNDER